MVSSRTPEGLPSRCPLCGADNALEFSDPPGDAPCPNCGHLLWSAAELLDRCSSRLVRDFDIAADRVTPDTPFGELGVSSLEMDQLVMQWEEQYDVRISEAEAEQIHTLGDAIRAILRYRATRRRDEDDS